MGARLMALPEGVTLAALVRPRPRALRLAARISSPLAVESDSYLGGFAGGRRLSYLDAKQFVWWAPGALPELPSAFSDAFSSAFR